MRDTMNGMQRILHTRTAPATGERRPSMAGALVCLLVLLAACSDAADHDSSESRGGTKEPAQSSPEGTVQVKADVQRALHLEVEPLSAMSAPREIGGYGRVLDPAPLASAVSERATARAAASASGQEFERVTMLQKQSTASVRALQSAEAAAVRDRQLAQSIDDRIVLSWGPALSRRPDLGGLIRALIARERAIVRVDLPLDAAARVQPRGARLTPLTEPGRALEAEFLGPAPVTDPQMQGQGFLFLTRGDSLDLTPGAAVAASLELGGAALRGVRLPESAVVRYEAGTWVYLQKNATTFVRTRVELGPAIPQGWLITQGLQAADRVVTQGAQVLLSEELKPQMAPGD